MALILEGTDLLAQCTNRNTGQLSGRYVYSLSFDSKLWIKMAYWFTYCRRTYKGRHNTCCKRTEKVGLKIEKIRDILLCMLIGIIVYIKLCH